MKYFALVLRVLLGGFFIWSGGVKLLDLKAFVETVANYQMLDRPIDAYVGYFVPWLEIFVGLAVLTGIFLRGGLFICGAMLLGFSAARHPRVIRSAKTPENAGCYKTDRDRAPNSPWIVTRFSQHGRAIRRAVGLVAPNVIVVLPIRRASCLNSRGERSRH